MLDAWKGLPVFSLSSSVSGLALHYAWVSKNAGEGSWVHVCMLRIEHSIKSFLSVRLWSWQIVRWVAGSFAKSWIKAVPLFVVPLTHSDLNSSARETVVTAHVAVCYPEYCWQSWKTKSRLLTWQSPLFCYAWGQSLNLFGVSESGALGRSVVHLVLWQSRAARGVACKMFHKYFSCWLSNCKVICSLCR